jgi:hypothetical protein
VPKAAHRLVEQGSVEGYAPEISGIIRADLFQLRRDDVQRIFPRNSFPAWIDARPLRGLVRRKGRVTRYGESMV